MKNPIYGYYFAILTKKGERGYIAMCPGVGGVYEEGATKQEALQNAYEAACAIFAARRERGDLLTEDNEFLTVLREPPVLSYISSLKPIRGGALATVPCDAVPRVTHHVRRIPAGGVRA